MSYQQEKFKEIADAIREKTGAAELIKPSEFAEKQTEVFDAGKKAEYDAFWDVYQQNGKRKSYQGAFAGAGWTADTFIPKYDLIVKGTARNMFDNALLGIDLEQHLADLGLTLDTSGVTSVVGFDCFCQYSSPYVLPVIDTRGTTEIRNLFYHSVQHTVRKIILKDDGSQKITNAFIGNKNLVNIDFEGVIGVSIDLHWSPLSKESVESVVSALSDTVTGQTVTFNNTQIEAINGESSWWTDLKATKPNWTFALADA